MKVIIISGPTATGKTNMAIELARNFGGEIVNFDSLLLYKEITIGTAKPTEEERRKIPHHMVDVTSISHPMNASDYEKAAFPVVEKLLKDKKNVYLTGGSGFYLQALMKGMYDSPTTPPEIQKRSEDLYESEGITPFRDILRQHDPASFERYHENDHYRIRRAVEHWWANHSRLSEQRSKKEISNTTLPGNNVRGWDILNLYLDIPKEEHLHIIEQRTDRMLESGLIEEVKALLAQGFTGLEKPLQSIGYKEALDFIFGVYKTKAECRERIVISTRQLAKSQRTWFNRDDTKLIFHPLLDEQKIIATVGDFLRTTRAS
ncbi:MAG: tRNA (adenosine(37)-N6)-dimethylallyltransferase MiaA [Bdellovibrionota bacterium]